MAEGIADFFNLKKSPVLNLFRGKTAKTEPEAYHGGGYGGGAGSNYAGGGQKFFYGMSTGQPVITLDHYRLRQQGRAAMQDSPEGRAIVERKVDAIAYTGLKLECTPDTSVLGITQEQAADWAKNTNARFDLYMNDKKQNRSETMTGYQSHWMYSWFKERDNDVFVRLYYSEDKSLQNPLQFEFIDADQIRGDAFTSSVGIQFGNDGITRDERGREKSYKVWIKDEKGAYEERTVQRLGPKSKRVFMLHGFSTEYAGQGRGFTKLAPILQELENLTDFKLSHIKMAINQSIMTGWVEPSDDEDTIPILPGNTPGGAGSSILNTDTESETADTGAELEGFECFTIPEATVKSPGMFIQSLTKGSKIKFGNPNAPGATYDKFTDSFLTNLAALSGTPLEVVQMKFGNSFSASRATLLLFQRIVEIQRQDMSADYLNPLFEMWMSGEIASGRISAPGWSDPRLRAAWLKNTWRGAPVPDIDPGKLAKADRDNVEAGFISADRVSYLKSGKAAAENIEANNRSYENLELPAWSQNAVPEMEDADDDTNGKEE